MLLRCTKMAKSILFSFSLSTVQLLHATQHVFVCCDSFYLLNSIFVIAAKLYRDFDCSLLPSLSLISFMDFLVTQLEESYCEVCMLQCLSISSRSGQGQDRWPVLKKSKLGMCWIDFLYFGSVFLQQILQEQWTTWFWRHSQRQQVNIIAF